MAARKLTRMEQIGILAAVVVIGTFGYLKFVNADPGRKLKRTKTEYTKLTAEVEKLRKEAHSGREKRALASLRKKVSKARDKLEQTETMLAQGETKDRVANTIVKMATESSLLIKTFGEITEKSAIGDISGGPAPYDHRYFTVTLKGRYLALQQFLNKIDNLPKLIAIRKIDIQKIEDEAYMRATVWIGI
jgi:Tfp pilus assembly protein PilO